LSCTQPGETVLDPFGGSGTTAAVAERLGRNAISIDIRESQCELTARRTGQTLELAG
jgi:modification methylase